MNKTAFALCSVHALVFFSSNTSIACYRITWVMASLSAQPCPAETSRLMNVEELVIGDLFFSGHGDDRIYYCRRKIAGTRLRLEQVDVDEWESLRRQQA